QREGHPGRHRDVGVVEAGRLIHTPASQGARRPRGVRGWRAPIAQLAEADGLKPFQCRFESDWGHRLTRGGPADDFALICTMLILLQDGGLHFLEAEHSLQVSQRVLSAELVVEAIVECITQAAEATGLRSAVAPGNPCVCFFENEVEALCDVLGRTCTARDSVEDDD